MEYPTRLRHLAVGRARFGERALRIAEFFHEGDPLGDAAATELDALPTGEGPRLLDAALDAMRDGREPVTSGPALDALFRQLRHVPFWVDRERCERGGTVFFRCGPLGGIALGFGALARSYCSAGGNKALMLTRALVDHVPQRLANTGKFVTAVSRSGGLDLGAEGFRQCVHVRLMHARIRRRAQGDPRWQARDWGLPINQADMAITNLLFSHGLAIYVRRLGGQVSNAEEADLIHLWRYAGYLLGVREELLCATPEEALNLHQLIDTIDGGPDEDTQTLLAPLLDRRPFETAFRHPAVGLAIHRMYLAACRDILGQPYADAVGLPEGAGDQVFRHLLRPLIASMTRGLSAAPFGDRLAYQAGQRYWAMAAGRNRSAVSMNSLRAAEQAPGQPAASGAAERPARQQGPAAPASPLGNAAH